MSNKSSRSSYQAGSSFNFHLWILKNKLSDIKSVFESHGMCTIETLSMQTSSFLELVEELSQHHPLFIPRVIAKLQAIQAKTPSLPPIQPPAYYSCVLLLFKLQLTTTTF